MGEGWRKQEDVHFKSLVFWFFSLKGNKQYTNKQTKVLLVLLFISHVFFFPILNFLKLFLPLCKLRKSHSKKGHADN